MPQMRVLDAASPCVSAFLCFFIVLRTITSVAFEAAIIGSFGNICRFA